MTKLFWGVLIFAAGVAVGWAATRQFSPEWVGAIGQWAGAAGTIAAIIWAVHTFQQESRQRLEDASDKLKAQFYLAEAVKVRCSGGGADKTDVDPSTPANWSLKSVWIRLMNGTKEPVAIVHFELPGIQFKIDPMRMLPLTLAAGQAVRETIDVEPVRVTDDEVSDKNPLKAHVPVLRYRIAGVTWERTGDDPPLRLM